MNVDDWLQRRQVAIYVASVILAIGFGVGLPSVAPIFKQVERESMLNATPFRAW